MTYVFGGGADTFPWSFPPQYPAYPGTDACLPIDFEAGGCPYFIADFYGVETTVIDNPDTTGNSSAKVAQVQKFAYSPETFGGSIFVLGTTDFTAGEVFTMKVWASRPVPVTFKLEGLDEQRVVTHSGSGAWEELIFDFTGFTTGPDVTQVTVFFDLANAGDAAGNPADWTFYIDDIALTESSSIPITYQLIWSDEFDVDGVPDTDNWAIDTGYGDNGWGNNEWQEYTDLPENIRVESDNLVITANCSLASTAPENCGVRDGTVTSGKVISQNKFSFRYGKAEARIKPPVGQGSWPAFWMLGANFSDVGWPFTGEIDIVEMFQTGGSNPQTTHFAIHWCDETKQNPATPDLCFPANEGWTFYSDELELGQSLGDDYHLFSAEWDANGITGKIDGIPYFYRAIDPGTMDEFLKEFFLILNVAMGGTLGSDELPPNGSETWPQIMLVDYVRVYQDVNNSDSTFTIGGGAPLDPLGVYSETHTDPAIAYGIENLADFGGKDTVIDENSSDTVLEGSVSLRADYMSTGTGPLNYNGFIFDFTSVVGGANLMTNGGFGSPEATAGDVPCHSDWNCFGSSFTTAADGPAFAPVSHNPEDNQSVKQFGNDGGTFQDVAVTVGETYEASVWAMNWTGNGTTDPFGEFAFVELSFRDGAGNLIPGSDSQVFVDPIDDGINIYLAPQDGADVSDWTRLTLSAVAPAGAVSARMLLIHQVVGGTGGTIRWDDASITTGAAGSATPEADISGYEVLKFGINTASASGLMDLEIKMDDSTSASVSVFLSSYTPTPGAVSGWQLYEIPLIDFAGIDQTKVVSLGYLSASSTVTGSTAVPPTLLDGTLYFDDIHFDQVNAVGGVANLMTNGGFGSPEATAGDVPCHSDWNCFGSSFTTAADGPAFAPVSHNPEDNQSVKQFGNDGGTFQDVAVTVGETYEASVWAMNWTGNGTTDPFGEFAFVELSFRDGAGNLIPGSDSQVFVDPIDDGINIYLAPQDGADVSDWTRLTLSAVAPAGAVSARMLLIHQVVGGTGGTIRWDDASISASP